MTLSALSSASRILIFLPFILLSSLSVAQRKPKSPPGSFESFLDTQWWLGLRFGVNYTSPNPVTRHFVFSPTDYEPELLEKTYSSFSLPGGQAGLDINFYHRGVSVGIQPTFKILRYGYENNLSWTGDGGADGLDTHMAIEQKLQVIEVPMILKYDFLKHGKIRPFILAGMQHSFLLGAQKKVTIEHTDYLSDIPQTYSGGSYTKGNDERMQNFWGAVGGVGTSLDYLNIRTVVEVTYLYGLTSITENENPYMENELVALGDVDDELKINNFNISLSFVFPLRYIDKTFQPY